MISSAKFIGYFTLIFLSVFCFLSKSEHYQREPELERIEKWLKESQLLSYKHLFEQKGIGKNFTMCSHSYFFICYTAIIVQRLIHLV